MATFARHYPLDTDPTVGYNSASALASGIAATARLAALGTQPVGKGEATGDYLWTQWSYDGNPPDQAPYIWARMVDQGGSGDQVDFYWHFNPAIKGAFDPILIFDPATGLFDQKVDAAHADWVYGLVGAVRFQNWVTGIAGTLVNSGLCGGTFSPNSCTVFLGTDGPRTGKVIALGHSLRYNPTAAEFTLGYQGIAASQMYAISFGGTDGHNILGNTSVATNVGVNATPQLVIQQGTSEAAWNNFQLSVDQIALELNAVSLTSNKFVTNNIDLGGGSPATEPAVPDVKLQVFNTPGELPKLTDGTSPISSLTTLPALLFAGLGALGTLAAGLVGEGIAALLGGTLGLASTAYGLLTSSVAGGVFAAEATTLPAVISGVTPIAALVSTPAVILGGLATLGTAAAEFLTSSVPAAIGANLPQLTHLSELASIQGTLSDLEVQAQAQTQALESIGDKLERLVNLLGSPPGDPDDDAHMLNAIETLTNRIELLAETRQELTVSAKGVTVQAFTGAVVEGEWPD